MELRPNRPSVRSSRLVAMAVKISAGTANSAEATGMPVTETKMTNVKSQCQNSACLEVFSANMVRLINGFMKLV